MTAALCILLNWRGQTDLTRRNQGQRQVLILGLCKAHFPPFFACAHLAGWMASILLERRYICWRRQVKLAGRRAPQQQRAQLLPARVSPTGRYRNTIKLSQKTHYRKCNYSKIQINVQRKLAPDRVSQASKSSWRQAAQANSPRRRTLELKFSASNPGWAGLMCQVIMRRNNLGVADQGSKK